MNRYASVGLNESFSRANKWTNGRALCFKSHRNQTIGFKTHSDKTVGINFLAQPSADLSVCSSGFRQWLKSGPLWRRWSLFPPRGHCVMSFKSMLILHGNYDNPLNRNNSRIKVKNKPKGLNGVLRHCIYCMSASFSHPSL